MFKDFVVAVVTWNAHSLSTEAFHAVLLPTWTRFQQSGSSLIFHYGLTEQSTRTLSRGYALNSVTLWGSSSIYTAKNHLPMPPHTSFPKWSHFHHKDRSHLRCGFLHMHSETPHHPGILKNPNSLNFVDTNNTFIKFHVFYSLYAPTPEKVSISQNFHVSW